MPAIAPRLGFDRLEDRTLPATFGVPWADPSHLTLSFAPGDTATPAGASTLAATMSAAGASAVWQREILRAFQSWASQANVDIGLVDDSGHPFGTSGAVQGDSRFGDLRIAAAPQTADHLATGSPFSWTGTTLSGDVVFNGAVPFQVGNLPGKYDVFTVAAHEAGHAFGLDHSDTVGSVMNDSYSFHGGLSTADVAAIRAMYGMREPDANDAVPRDNGIASRASAIPYGPTGGPLLLTSGDLTTTSDVDYFRFNVPAALGLLGVSVRIKSSEISLMTPRVTVYNSSGAVVASGQTVDPLSNDVSLRFNGGLFGGTFTVRVEGATENVFGIGGYKLAVDYLSLTPILAPILTTVTGLLDGHSDDTLGSALGLTPIARPTSDSRFDYTFRGVVEDSIDVDTYKLTAAGDPAAGPVTMNALVWGLDANPVDPRVRVYDASGAPVAFEVLANDNGRMGLQLLNVTPGADYFLQIAASQSGDRGTGRYFLAADFNQLTPITFDAIGSHAIGAGISTTGLLNLNESGVFEFVVSADFLGSGTGGVRMSLVNAAGTVVLTADAIAGQPPITRNQYVTAGTYTVRYTHLGPTTGTIAPVLASVYFTRLDDPVGPYKTTTSSGTGTGSSETGTGGYTYTSSSTTQTKSYGVYY